MKIVCKIKRKLGTHTKMPDDGTVYDFVPNAHGDHVAEVTNHEHIKRLLSIDVYVPYEAPADVQAVAPTEDTPSDPPPADTALADLEKMTLEELQGEYHYRFGRAAPKLAKFGTLVQRLTEARAEGLPKE